MIDGLPTGVVQALKNGDLPKNYRINVLNDDGTVDFTIDNNTLVSESVKLDERMCSGDILKFGLCEGSSLEFQYFDHPSILGRRLQCFVDVTYNISEAHTEYAYDTDPWGENYIPDVGYNNVTWVLSSSTEDAFDEVRIMDSQGNIHRYYSRRAEGDYATVCSFTANAGDMIVIFWNDNGSGRDGAINSAKLEYIYYTETEAEDPATIPMGFYTVAECPRQVETGIRRATAYNKLQSKYLDEKANSLLETAFSDLDELMLVDIQNFLLNEYQIQKKLWPIEAAEDSSIGGTDVTLNGIPMYFTELYGIETPLSACMYDKETDVSLSSPIYLYFRNGRVTYELSGVNDIWTIYQNFGRLSVLETHMVERLKEIIDGAQLRTTSTTPPFTGGTVTGDALVDFLCKNSNFCNFCGIEINRNGVREKYSTVQYEYEEREGITHTVAGTIDDFFLTMKEGAADIYINYPYRLDGLFLPFTSGTEPVFARIPYGQLTWENRYWLDSNRSSAPIWIYPIKYENGDDFEASYLGGNYTSNITEALTCGTVDLTNAEKIKVTVGELPDFTLRDITSAIYETQCLFGKLDRETDLFSGVELSQGLAAETITKNMYSKLWADEGNVHKWKYLIITYKGLDGEGNETEYKLQRTVDEHGTDNYNCSDNWLFRNLVWTAEQIEAYADAMVEKMRNVTWFPFEMWGAGLPYLETGDKIEVIVGEESYNTYVLQRQLKGIQDLQDTYINGTLDIY